MIGSSVASGRMISLALIMALSVQISFPAPQGERSVAGVKAKIAKLGTGKEARATVKLKDGRTLKGYISELDDKGFTIVDKATKNSTRVSYSEVEHVKGKKFPARAKRAIVTVAIFVAVVIIIERIRGPIGRQEPAPPELPPGASGSP